MEKEIENLIEQLTKVRPERLNEEALKLFNTIMIILDERDKLKNENKQLKEYIFVAPNLDEMTAVKYLSIQRDAYFRGRAEEQQRAEEIIYNNYISKSIIKEKIEPVIDSLEKDSFVGYADELRDIMSELMEDK